MPNLLLEVFLFFASGLFQDLNDNPLVYFNGSRIHNSPDGSDVRALLKPHLKINLMPVD